MHYPLTDIQVDFELNRHVTSVYIVSCIVTYCVCLCTMTHPTIILLSDSRDKIRNYRVSTFLISLLIVIQDLFYLPYRLLTVSTSCKTCRD